MMLKVSCLFLAVAIVSAIQEAEDPFKSIKVKTYLPGDPKNKHDKLVVKCVFDLAKTDMSSVSKIRLYASPDGEENNYKSVGSVDDNGMSYGLKKTEIKVKGKLKEAGKKSKLVIKYKVDDLGYCQFYKCMVSGRATSNNKLKAYYNAPVELGAADGGSCD